jgi:CheY-like chemotaxis protein
VPSAPDITPGAPGRFIILIVDDDPLNVGYLEQALADLEYETISATNRQEALDTVAAAWRLRSSPVWWTGLPRWGVPSGVGGIGRVYYLAVSAAGEAHVLHREAMWCRRAAGAWTISDQQSKERDDATIADPVRYRGVS